MNKFYCILFLFTSIVFSQDSNNKYSIILNDNNINVVYRGITNHISIYVNEAKSFNASGIGLKKVSTNNFLLNPGVGNEIEMKLEITLLNDSIVNESTFFKIKDIPSSIGLINGNNCFNCIVKLSKNEFLNAVISYKIPDFQYQIKYNKVISFEIVLSKKEIFLIDGDKIPIIISNKIKKGKTIKIINIKTENPLNICFQKIQPIEVLITE